VEVPRKGMKKKTVISGTEKGSGGSNVGKKGRVPIEKRKGVFLLVERS